MQTVYDFTITPDDGRAPSGGSATANNFAGYEELDGNNDLTSAVGNDVSFTYTLTNNTNNAIGVLLEALQATTDDFNLAGVTIAVTDAAGVPVTAVGGVYTLEQNGVYTATVTGTIPPGVQGNAAALIDLVATNQGAAGEPAPTVGPNVSYENNNVGRVTVGEVPVIGAANTATSVNNGDGSYTVTYTLNAENFSNVALGGVQLTDNLAATFAGATSFSVTSVTSTDFTVNPGFTGTPTGATGEPSLNLLAADQSLAIGATGTVTVSVRVVPGTNLGPYNNQVTASGTTPGGESTNDLSTNSADPDQNGAIPANDGDGNPNNTDSPTPVTFTETPVLGVAKAASAVTDGPNGSFDVTYTVTLENSGNVALSGLQVTDALSATFPAPATFTVGDLTTTGNLTPNPNFDGDADTNLLGAGSTLAAGTTETVSFTVSFIPNGLTGPFANSATGSASSPAGTTVSDDSTLGSDPVAGDAPSATPITFTANPVIGVAKAATVTDFGNANPNAGAVTPGVVELTFTVENLGDVNLSSLSLVDDLNATFGAGNYTVTSGPTVAGSTTVTASTTYDGGSDTELLGAGSSLDIGETATVTLTVNVTAPGAYTNQATATGTGPGGAVTTDLSDDGANPDSDGDGVANEAGENDPTPITFDALRADKSARVCEDAACNTVVDPDADGGEVAPGQYIEYTITTTNLGGATLSNITISDAVPLNTVFAYSASTSAGAECDSGAGFAACPTGTGGDTDESVAAVRLPVGELIAGATADLIFVVLVP